MSWLGAVEGTVDVRGEFPADGSTPGDAETAASGRLGDGRPVTTEGSAQRGRMPGRKQDIACNR